MDLAIIKISGKSLEDFTTGKTGVNLIKNLQKKYSSVILIHGGGKIISSIKLPSQLLKEIHSIPKLNPYWNNFRFSTP